MDNYKWKFADDPHTYEMPETWRENGNPIRVAMFLYVSDSVPGWIKSEVTGLDDGRTRCVFYLSPAGELTSEPPALPPAVTPD